MSTFEPRTDLSVLCDSVRLYRAGKAGPQHSGYASAERPTLRVAGRCSNGAIDPAAIAAHQTSPDSRIVTIADRGHIVSYIRSDELGEAILEFFAEVLGTPLARPG